MVEDITATFEQLETDGGRTARGYFTEAIAAIDDQFGDGFAKKNPLLLGAFMQTSQLGMAQALISQQVRYGLERVAEAIAEGTSSLQSAVDDLDRTVQRASGAFKYG